MLPRVRKVNLHPPALDPGDEEGEDEIIPWVLLENTAYVADRRNATTAFSDCRGYDGTIQASLFVARPPRLSYICVFYRSRRRLQFQIGEEPLQQQQEGEEQMIPITPKVIATDESLVLLGIELGDRDVGAIQDMYVYQPGGDGGPPLLTRLQRIPCRYMFRASDVGLVSCSNSNSSSSSSSSYMVAVLCPMDHRDVKRSMMGQFILCLYDSELRTWTPTTVSVDDQTFQKYQEEGYFVHLNTKAIAAGRGGEHASATMAFVDICRGILVCDDLSQVEHKPWLRYVPLPHRLPARAPRDGPRFSRDIAVVDGHFKFVRQTIRSGGGWTCQTFTRPVVVDGNCWVPVCSMDSSNMDVQGFHHLLPRLEDDDDEGRHLPPLEGFEVWLPVLSLDTDCNTICLMVWNTSVVWNDAKAWVMAVDMKNSRLQGVSQFDPSRYRMVGIAYQHSRISRYLKRAQGKNENLLLPGSSNKKVGGGGDMPLD